MFIGLRDLMSCFYLIYWKTFVNVNNDATVTHGSGVGLS